MDRTETAAWRSALFALLLGSFLGFGPLRSETRHQRSHPSRPDPSGAVGGPTKPWETLRGELTRLQEETGVTLASIQDNKLYTISFADRTASGARAFLTRGTAGTGAISQDGSKIAFDWCPEPGITHPTPYRTDCPAGLLRLAMVRADGTGFRQYSRLTFPAGECWSYDNSMLELTVDVRKEGVSVGPALRILEVGSGDVQDVTDYWDAHSTSQCWSPDGKRTVYWVNLLGGGGIVRLWDTVQKKSTDLAKGRLPTWSPDGQWIAYLDCADSGYDCTYYAIRPSGTDRRVLFRTEVAGEALVWSPDSRLVAYVGYASGQDEQLLWVRRLEDGEEDWFAKVADTDVPWFQWLRNANILKR